MAAPLAERFGRSLTTVARAAGGETTSRRIGAEDHSRQIVDIEARIRTRETLIRRLSTLLETRSGNIQQAVEAERAINQAQEELDAARAWLAEMRGRVVMSRIAIAYEAAPAATTEEHSGDPLTASWSQVSRLTVRSLAALLLVLGLTLPWAAVGYAFWWVARWHRRRQERSAVPALEP